jgi:hypothetical protein
MIEHGQPLRQPLQVTLHPRSRRVGLPTHDRLEDSRVLLVRALELSHGRGLEPAHVEVAQVPGRTGEVQQALGQVEDRPVQLSGRGARSAPRFRPRPQPRRERGWRRAQGRGGGLPGSSQVRRRALDGCLELEMVADRAFVGGRRGSPPAGLPRLVRVGFDVQLGRISPRGL